MNSIKEYIESGVLELYVLGNTTPEQKAEVEKMGAAHKEIEIEIDNISKSLHRYAQLNTVQPDPNIKPFLMAVIDYTERLKNGEAVSYPPMINENSAISDYADWLNQANMAAPENLTDVYAKIIGNTQEMVTAIVWIKEMAPQETHHDEFEKFLIVEGSCDITIGQEVHQLTAGDVLSIPLYKNHFVKVTSAIPCKIILQRIAA